MTEYRASFDAAIRFSNGDLTAHGFRVDVPSPDIDQGGIAALFVASLGLLMTDSVELSNVTVFAEPHKGTRAGPSDHGGDDLAAGGRLVELSHVIRAGMLIYPGLPGPEITPYLTREASRAQYAPGTEFAFDRLTLVGNTGPISTRPITGIPTARTSAPSRWPRSSICRRWWPGWPARNSAVSVSGSWQRSMSAAEPCCCTPATTHGAAQRTTPMATTS